MYCLGGLFVLKNSSHGVSHPSSENLVASIVISEGKNPFPSQVDSKTPKHPNDFHFLHFSSSTKTFSEFCLRGADAAGRSRATKAGGRTPVASSTFPGADDNPKVWWNLELLDTFSEFLDIFSVSKMIKVTFFWVKRAFFNDGHTRSSCFGLIISSKNRHLLPGFGERPDIFRSCATRLLRERRRPIRTGYHQNPSDIWGLDGLALETSPIKMDNSQGIFHSYH